MDTGISKPIWGGVGGSLKLWFPGGVPTSRKFAFNTPSSSGRGIMRDAEGVAEANNSGFPASSSSADGMIDKTCC